MTIWQVVREQGAGRHRRSAQGGGPHEQAELTRQLCKAAVDLMGVCKELQLGDGAATARIGKSLDSLSPKFTSLCQDSSSKITSRQYLILFYVNQIMLSLFPSMQWMKLKARS